MRKPIARPTNKVESDDQSAPRPPKAFVPAKPAEPVPGFAEAPSLPDLVAPPQAHRNWLARFAWSAGGILVSLGLGLAAERLITDLFARYEWLGWAGLAALAAFVLALLLLTVREIAAVSRLRHLDRLRLHATQTIENDVPAEGQKVLAALQSLYANRPDMARIRKQLDASLPSLFAGIDMVVAAERYLMSPLDARARALTAASARRVAIVTAISPRALVDVAFVTYESIKLARAIADLYGARPGLMGSWRLAGAILGHLAVTGGVALGDSVVQQLLGHGLAAKISARLGEGLVNGLMTVRVGIAAMRVTRPLPFHVLKQPIVMDFIPELAQISSTPQTTS